MTVAQAADALFLPTALLHTGAMLAFAASPAIERDLLWVAHLTAGMLAVLAAVESTTVASVAGALIWVGVGWMHAGTLGREYEVELHRRQG